MSEELKKLTAEELESVKSIRQEYTNLSISLGELELQAANIAREKQRLLDVHKQTIEKESELAKQLQEKYGSGSINIETGEITQ